MKQWMLALGVAVVTVGVATADDKADAVVKKAVEAHGGAEALSKYKASRMNMKGAMHVMGMAIEYTGKTAYAAPDRSMFEINADIAGMKLTISQKAKGDKYKTTVKVGDMTIPNPDDEKEEVKVMLLIQEAERIVSLLDKKKFTLTIADDEDVNGKKASVIVAKPATSKKEIRFFFDKESGLMVRHSHQGRGPGEAGETVDVLEDTYLSDYKKINGVQVPQKLETKHDGKKFLTADLTDIEVLEKLDDAIFALDD